MRLMFCIIALTMMAPAGWAKSAKTYIVDLSPMRLDRALTHLARQTHISVDFANQDLHAVRQDEILGLFTREEALAAVLAGTGYSYQNVGGDAYRIIRAPKTAQINPVNPSPVPPVIVAPDYTRDVIIVRATKRAGLAERLPMSLSVMDGEQIEKLQITDTNAVALHTAGMASTNLGPSRNKIFIRGVSDGSFTGRQQATIGAYLDNIRLNYNEPDPFLQLEDIDHVEVLRGPQGSLYGAGSLGGIYRVITNAPDMENYTASISLDTSLTKNGGQNGKVSATINMPLVQGRLALRVTGYADRDAGYIDDVRLNLKNVNETNVFGSRARVLLDLGEHYEVTAGLNFQDVIADDTQYALGTLGAYQRDNFVREPHEDDFLNPYLDIKGRFRWGDFVSSTAFVKRSIDDHADASLAVPRLTSLPVTPSTFVQDRTINMITNETRLVSRLGGPFDWLIGGFVSQRHETFNSSLVIPGSAAVLPGGARDGDLAFSEARRENINEIAVFGEATWHLPYRFDLTGGGRWFHSDARTRSTVDGALGKAPVMTSGLSRDRGFTPKFVLSYQANDSTLLYGQYTQGYRVGGINLNSPDSVFFETDEKEPENRTNFEPDKLVMYEVGGKFTSRDDRLHVDVAAFVFRWNDIQTDQILPDGFTFILNAGYAKSKGVDIDVIFQPFNGLLLDANLSYNDPNLVRPNPFLGAQSNDHLPSIPTFAGGLSAEYSWSAGAGRTWQVSADYAFSGPSQLTFARTDNRNAQTSHIMNVRLGLASDKHWQAALYARNILDEKANTFAFGNAFNFRQNTHLTPPTPFTVGVTLKKEF